MNFWVKKKYHSNLSFITISNIANMTKEKWKDFPMIHGRSFSKYEVSSLGRIRNKESGYIFSTKPKDDRYVCNSFLDDEGKTRAIRAHIIVARAFLGEPESIDITVDHINQNPTDNRLVNLRWATKKQQVANSNKSRSGALGQPIVQYTADMKEIKTWPSIITAANKLGIDPSGITKACKGKLNHTGGYKWGYERQDLDGEIWKEYIPGTLFQEAAEDVCDVLSLKSSGVQVSNMGRIKSHRYHIVYGSKVGGYMTYGKPVKGVHVMVAEAFLSNPENKPEVNHKDKDGTNNKLENLEWATRSEQMIHSHKTNSNPNRYSTAKAVKQYDLEGNFIREFRSRSDAAKQTGCQRSGIFKVCTGIYKSTGGFIFTYSDKELIDLPVIHSKEVFLVDSEGGVIETYEDVKAAAFDLKISCDSIYRVLNGKRKKTRGGYYFRR